MLNKKGRIPYWVKSLKAIGYVDPQMPTPVERSKAVTDSVTARRKGAAGVSERLDRQ